jgi:hypothetical protein
MDAPRKLYDIVAKQVSGKAKRGDKRLDQTRALVEQYGSVIDPANRSIIAERMT